MGSISSLDISASGLSAQRQRLDVIANNIANADTTRTAKGGPYQREQVVFSAHMESLGIGAAQPAGVDPPTIVADSTPAKQIYEPGHPDADAQGYVKMPNVNVVQEMVDMVSATRAYEANVTAMNAAKTMSTKALELGRG
jgi:flagellar basal-body rod protein FlgC